MKKINKKSIRYFYESGIPDEEVCRISGHRTVEIITKKYFQVQKQRNNLYKKAEDDN